MNFETIETERLILRKLTAESYYHIFDNCSDKEIMDCLNISSTENLNKDKAKVKKGISTFNKSFIIFQIFYKKNKSIIGWCGFHTWYTEHYRAEIGYELTDENLKSKGLMTEAFKEIINFGFTTMKLNRIEAFIEPENIPSFKLIKKFGFIREGQLRNHYLKNDVFEDSVVFSLLKNEYN